jgi:hypothetical protein
MDTNINVLATENMLIKHEINNIIHDEVILDTSSTDIINNKLNKVSLNNIVLDDCHHYAKLKKIKNKDNKQISVKDNNIKHSNSDDDIQTSNNDDNKQTSNSDDIQTSNNDDNIQTSNNDNNKQKSNNDDDKQKSNKNDNKQNTHVTFDIDEPDSLIILPSHTYDIVSPHNNIVYSTVHKYGTIATPTLKRMLLTEHIRPALLRDMREKLKGRTLWSKISNYILVSSKILMIFVSIFAFAGSKYTSYWWLSFIAGILGVSSLSLMQFSMFASNVSRDCTADLNILLKSLHMEHNNIPDLENNNNNNN